MNEGLTVSSCPRCGRVEDWEHVILCDGIQDQKEKYLKDMEDKLKKVASNEKDRDTVELIARDVQNYLN